MTVKFSKNEMAIMKNLWLKNPQSHTELLKCNDIKIGEKALYANLGSLQILGAVHISGMVKGKRKAVQLYAPKITQSEYLANKVEAHLFYEADTILPPLLRRLTHGVKHHATFVKLHEILEEAEKKLE